MKSKSFSATILAALLITALIATILTGCGGSGTSNSTTAAGTTVAGASTTTAASTAENTTTATNTEASQSEATTTEKPASNDSKTTEATTTTSASTSGTTEAATESAAKLTPWGYDASDIYLIKQLGVPSEFWKKFSETEVGAVILDKFGIDFEIVPFTETEVEKQKLLLASGDFVEIAGMQTEAVRQAYIDAGALVPMDDYLDKMPEFKRIYVDQIPYWRASSPDKKLYYWQGNGTPLKLKTDIVGCHCVMVRADILELYAEKYGWDKPPIYSDEWIEVFRIASEAGLKDVDGNKMIGLTACFGESWGLAGIASSFFEQTSHYHAGSSRTIVYDFSKDAYVGIIETEILKEQYKFFNSLWNIGMLDEESFTDLGPQTVEKEHKAAAAGFWYVSWDEASANAFIVEAGHPEMQYVQMPVVPVAERGNRLAAFTNVTRDFYNIGVTTNAKNPGRIFELLEYLRSDEGAFLSQNGIEGIHWKYENGVRTENQEYFDKIEDDPVKSNLTGISVFEGLGFPVLYTFAADGYPIFINRSDEYRARHAKPDYLPNIVRAKYGWTSACTWLYDNTDIKSMLLPSAVSFESGSDFDILNKRMLEVRLHHIYDVWTAKDFESAWNKMLDEYHTLDVQSVYDEYAQIARGIAAAALSN